MYVSMYLFSVCEREKDRETKIETETRRETDTQRESACQFSPPSGHVASGVLEVVS